MKIVYLWKDGQPVLVDKNEDGEYVYPDEKWTENKPPQGIYSPYYYNGQKWIGQYEKDLAISQLTSTVAELTDQVELLQTGMAQIIEQYANNELEAK